MIGREKERKRLLNALEDDESRFIAVYGRRRVGKTYLVRETFAGHFTFAHAGLSSGVMSDQLERFCNSLREWGLADCKKAGSWIEAFEELKRLVSSRKDKRKVIFIDELPWMSTPKSRFLPAFENFWNSWASARKDIVLVVCGSATSWLLDKIVRSKGGLHNRVTHRIRVRPFTLRECEEYSAQRQLFLDRWQIADFYMAFGGVAYYWSLIEKGESSTQAIDRLYFSGDGELQGEFNELYRSLFRRPEPYMRIVKALGTRRSGLIRSEIAAMSSADESGHLSEYLEELIECGFVRKYCFYGKRKKDSVYQLVDNFTLFHFHFSESRNRHGVHYWTASLDSQKHVVWSGLAFEMLCLEHIEQIKAALGIGGIMTEVCAWRGKTPEGKAVQIDLLIDRQDGIINLCEIKHSSRPYVMTKHEAAALADRQWALKENIENFKTIHMTFIAPAGLVHNSQTAQIQKEITLSDLFCNVLP